MALKKGKTEPGNFNFNFATDMTLNGFVNSNPIFATNPELNGALLKYNSEIPVAAEQTDEQTDGTTENANEAPVLGLKSTLSSSSSSSCVRAQAGRYLC